VNDDLIFGGQDRQQVDEEVVGLPVGSQQVIAAQSAACDQIGVVRQDLSWLAHAGDRSKNCSGPEVNVFDYLRRPIGGSGGRALAAAIVIAIPS